MSLYLNGNFNLPELQRGEPIKDNTKNKVLHKKNVLKNQKVATLNAPSV